MRYLEKIIEKAKNNKKTIVLPESNDIRTLKATVDILNQGIANVILLGEPSAINELGAGLDLSGATIINPAAAAQYDRYCEELYELRKAKGLTKEQAAELLLNPLYFGVMMVKMNEADGMVAGAINSTGNTLRPALQILKTAPGTKIVSSFFIMDVPDCAYGDNGIVLFSDCGLIENPSAEELSEIAISSAKSFHSFVGGTPNVAMLSYSTKGSAKSELTEKVVEATRLVKEKQPEMNVDGELQLDAAIVPAIGELKSPGSKVAGKANTFIFPDLNSGNIGYKLVQRFAKAEAYGPILQGIAKPVNDLSRGCSAEDIVGVVALTCVQAQNL